MELYNKMSIILIGNVCPNIIDTTGKSLKTGEEKWQVFLNRYIAQSDKEDKETRINIKR